MNVGLHKPYLVQVACIPTILAGADVVVAAETGSGKTHGYLVPLIDRLYGNMEVSKSAVDDQKRHKNHHVSLVLCPNVILCEQVSRMANSFMDDNGVPLLTAAAICGWQVFDEADLLLCGSFQNQVIRLINMLRFNEKQLFRLEKAGFCGAGLAEEDEDSDDISAIEDLALKSENRIKQDWRRVGKLCDRSKQYVFVEGILPLNGKNTTGRILKRMFPDTSWVSGSYLYRQNPRFERKWVEVTNDKK